MNDPWKSQMEALGSFIRTQRKLADLSLRELAEMTEVSNPYLSQLERGLHQPSVRVLKSIANALNVSAETLLVQAGLLENGEEGDPAARSSVESAIRTDPVLSGDQKEALINVYRAVAEEVVQDAWVGVLAQLDRFEGRSSLKTWVLRIVANQARTRAVRERRTLPFSTLDGPDEPPGRRAGAVPAPRPPVG